MFAEFPPQLLTEHQRSIATRVLAEESSRRRHVVVALSGAHAYGFPSPDSDLDLKAIHAAPTSSLVGLRAAAPAADRVEIIEGVEIDYTSNEIGLVLAGILKGNGNYIERVLGKLQPVTSPELEGLRPIVLATLSRRIHAHYQGFATSQQHALDNPEKASAKKVLYVLRTTLTGAHALDTGRLETDLTRLLDGYGFDDARELIELKRSGERVPLGAERLKRWRARLADAFATLNKARDRSSLPEAPPNEDEVEAWLLGLRKRLFE
jgi:predicted nucleotidyltransferase